MPAHIAISTLYIVQSTKVQKDKVQKDGSTIYKVRKDGSTEVQKERSDVGTPHGVRDTALTASAEGASGSESRK